MEKSSIIKATESDCNAIVHIGKIAVAESHRDSCTPEVMNEFLEKTYNNQVMKEELNNKNNIYYLINYNNQPVGFSKLVLNARHPNIVAENVALLDRIYLLKEYHGLRLGLEILNFNITLSKDNDQSGVWLYTWIGNKRAVDFYCKAGFVIIGSHKYFVTKTHYDVSHQMFLHFSEQ